MTEPTAADLRAVRAWHSRIAGETDITRLVHWRATLVSQMPPAATAGRMVWLVMAIESRTLIDRWLKELAAGGGETPTGRKTSGRPRGYIESYSPQAKTLALLEDVDSVLTEYREHWPLTCRQIFYRLVGAFGYEKSEAFYSKLCHHLANARRGGRVEFDAIRDDGVSTVTMRHFDDEEHFKAHVRALAENYRRNLLATQPVHIEVWCEASGMVFQLAEVAEKFSIRVYSSSGFDSLTAKKELAERICTIGKPAVILHLGDFDPSGESIFEAQAEDVAAFVATDRPWNDVTVRFERVALSAAQVEAYRLPTAPAKKSDSRSKRWDGETCQLEALAPDVIAGILRRAIGGLLDADQFQQDMDLQAVERRRVALALPAPSVRDG